LPTPGSGRRLEKGRRAGLAGGLGTLGLFEPGDFGFQRFDAEFQFLNRQIVEGLAENVVRRLANRRKRIVLLVAGHGFAPLIVARFVSLRGVISLGTHYIQSRMRRIALRRRVA
jgi:hypothetical protein